MTSEAPAQGRGDPELAATFAAPRKLHVAAAVASSLSALRGLALPLVAVVFLGSSTGGFGQALIGVGLGAVFSLGAGIVSWNATSYQLSDGSLRFRHGAFSPDDTLIPVARIQAIDTVQGPIQRLFGVVELHVQTPGGGAHGEIVLRAVEPRDARALRAALGHPEPAAPSARRRLGPRGLVLAALTGPQFGVVLPVVGAAFAGAQDLFGNTVGESLLQRVATVPQALRAAAIILAATLVVSFLASVVAFAGFEVERDGDRLRIRRGLLQRRAASVPVARVDGVSIVEGLLRAPFGLATVRLETAGYRAEQAAAKTLFPLVRTRDIPALLAELLPGLDDGAVRETARLERPPTRALRRYLLPPTLAGATVGAVVAVAAGPAEWWWPAVLLGAAGALDGRLNYRAAGVRLEPDRVILRSRRGTARVTVLARRGRLQELGVRRNPLQRRARLASFEIALGSGRRGRVRHLEAASADAALAALRP
jgi:putative membrane protein